MQIKVINAKRNPTELAVSRGAAVSSPVAVAAVSAAKNAADVGESL